MKVLWLLAILSATLHAMPIRGLILASDVNLNFVKNMVSDNPEILTTREWHDWSLFHWATQNGHADIVEYLVTAGAYVDAVNNYKETPLLVAVYNGQAKIVELLINAGANVNVVSKFMGNSLLHLAAMSGRADIAQLLIAAGAKVDAVDEVNQTPLHQAASEDRTNVVEVLISAGANLNAVNNWHETPMLRAALKGYAKVAELLVAAGADANIPDDHQWTPLVFAAAGGYPDFAEVLLESGIEFNPACRCSHKPSLRAVSHNQANVVDVFIDYGVILDQDHSTQFAGLLTKRRQAFEAAENGDLEQLKALNVRSTMRNEQHWTLLHFAASQGHLDVVKYLFERLEDKPELLKKKFIQALTKDGISAILLALKPNHAAVAQFLLNRNASIDGMTSDVQTALHLAAKHGHAVMVEKMLNNLQLKYAGKDWEEFYNAVNARDVQGHSALHLASDRGHAQTVQTFLKFPNCLITKDMVKNARNKQHLNVVGMLEDYRRDLTDHLIVMTLNRDIKEIERALKQGADMHMPLDATGGKSAVQIAAEKEFDDLISLFNQRAVEDFNLEIA